MSKQKSVSKDKDDSRLFAFLATFLSIIGFIIALVARKNDKYVMHYAKQSLVVFIASVILSILGAILNAIFFFPFYNGIPGTFGAPGLFSAIASLLNLILWLFSWIYALSGEMKEVPIVGKYARKFNF